MRKIILLTFLFLITGVLIACQGPSLGEVNHEDIFSHIEKGTAFEAAYEPLLNIADDPVGLGEHLDEIVLTGKWFINNQAGQISYSSLSGYYEKGTIEVIELFTYDEEVMIDESVIVSIVKLEDDSKEVSRGQTISKQVFKDVLVDGNLQLASVTIPEESGIFLLSIDTLTEEGKLTDRVISVFYNDLPKLSLSLEVKTETENEAVWFIHNTGQTTMSFGVDYVIEKYDGEVWRKVPLDLAFIEIAVELPPGQTYQDVFSLEELSLGQHRLVKTVYDTNTGKSVTLQAPFSID